MRKLHKIRHFALSSSLFLAAAGFAVAQNSLDMYTSAVRQSRISDRMAGMEKFLSTYPKSGLRGDALEVLVWDSLESGQREQARTRAKELRQIDPQNALALAVVSEERAEVAGRSDRKGALQAFEMAKSGIQAYPQLHHPEGMSDGEFIQVQRQVVSILDGEAGLGYLANKDYPAARRYLHESVAIRPEDPRYIYGLALALLDGKDPVTQEGYLYLARTVNLTRGSAAGQQIATYAEKRFENSGGTPDSWNEYLAAAQLPGTRARSTTELAATQATKPAAKPAPTATASTATAAKASAPVTAPPVTAPKTTAPTVTASAAPPKNVPPPNPTRPNPTRPNPIPPTPTKEAEPEEPESIPPSPAPYKREYVARTSPVSMGILLQTEHLTRENRKQIFDALSDMVRHLRNDDEVFIMAYGKKLDFEQDLTGNPKLLEEAMSQIKPETGTALLDAVAFAAGHLERIATNKNRILLVISDGRNTPSQNNPLTLSQKLNTVRVDCIGLEVGGDSGRRQLESLAAYSGGQVSFANDSSQLRSAAVQMAEGIGIEFPN